MSVYRLCNEVEELTKVMKRIETHLAWIARCHYQEFRPMVEKRPEPFISKYTWTASTQHITTSSLPF